MLCLCYSCLCYSCLKTFSSFFSQPSLNKTVTLPLILTDNILQTFSLLLWITVSSKHGSQTSKHFSYLAITNRKLSMAHSALTCFLPFFLPQHLHLLMLAVTVYDPYNLILGSTTLMRVSSPMFMQLIFLKSTLEPFLYHFCSLPRYF